MLLSSLSLSAQKKESYEYSSYAYKTGTDTHEPIKINNETFNVFYDYDSGIYTLSISFDYGDNFPDDYYDENFSCVYRGQLKDGRYVYSGVETFVRNGRIRVYDITNEVVVFTNYTLDRLMYNYGSEDKEHIDKSNVIEFQRSYNSPRLFIYPIKNKEN